MKTYACNAVLLLAIFKCTGQTNFVVTTNWVTASSEFREIDGKLYNTSKSAKFQSFKGRCVEVLTNGILFQKVTVKSHYRIRSDGANRTGNFLGQGSGPAPMVKVGEETIVGESVFVRNFIGTHSGAEVSFRAMLVGKTKIDGETFEAYDYGLPHIVPVLVTNRTATRTGK
jgi:hypothetical protein